MKSFAASGLLFLAAFFCVPLALAAPQSSVLDQARAAAAAGYYDQASQLFKQVLAVSPDNIDALGGLTDSLVATGRWRDAVPALQHLDQLQPNNAVRIFQLGQMQSWLGERAQALELLKHAADLNSANAQYQEYYAEVLSWNDATRPQALTILRALVAAHPNDENALLSYAEILSWNGATRSQALESYKKILAQDPNNARALAGEAQLLSWNGQSDQAMEIYQKVLAADPNNVAALRGEGEILNWRGKHREALDSLEEAHGLAPDDSATMLDLAQTEYDLGDYADARTYLQQVKGIDTPEYEDLQRNVNHALGSYFELGYVGRRDGQILDYDSAQALVSTPLGVSNRLSLQYQPYRFNSMRIFNSNYYDVALDSQPSENVTTHVDVGARTYPGVSSQIEGGFDATFKVNPSFQIETSAARRWDDESLVSTLGAETNGIFVGEVQTNLASIGGSYSNSVHHYDMSLTFTDGAYTGENLASNRRWSVDGNFGKSIRGDHPYIRVAYGFTYLSFDHDADFVPGSGEPARVTGGYYSPTKFLLNYAQIFFSGNFGRHVKWDFGGTSGAQNAETTFTSFSTVQFASTGSAHLTWNMTGNDDLRLGYDYLNTFNAFHRHLFFVTWRHYF
ncbi:MAG TPA: tetratricopeptide repeat protein [Candidatus Acidoferrales bacterium]|nr:tetratricopeptide repeat protein [Candidatus Acidoferrales bacterium]